MEKVVVDSSLPDKLEDIYETVELWNAEGVMIGKFIPDTTRFEPPPLSEEEYRRRENEPGGRTLSEILADLEKRA